MSNKTSTYNQAAYQKYMKPNVAMLYLNKEMQSKLKEFRASLGVSESITNQQLIRILVLNINTGSKELGTGFMVMKRAV